MKIFNEYLIESIETMGDSLQYILGLLKEKELISRLVAFERDSVGDLTSISFDVSDISPKKREYIVSCFHANGYKNATIEFHEWNKLWIICIERIRIQRKSTANNLVSTFYNCLTKKHETQNHSDSIEPKEEKPSMFERITGKKINK